MKAKLTKKETAKLKLKEQKDWTFKKG